MAIQNDSQYPVLTTLINNVKTLENESIKVVSNESERIENELARKEAEDLRQKKMQELEDIDVVKLDIKIKDKANGIHYHGFDTISGLMEKLNAIDSKITDVYTRLSAIEPEILEIVSIDSVADITAVTGTELVNVVLPTTVWVALSNNTREQRPVAWSGASLISESDTERQYSFNGTLNNTNLKATVKVIIQIQSDIVSVDSFTRADSALTLGNSETAQPWIVGNNSIWGISGNQAYLAAVGTSGSTVAVIETGRSNAIIEVDALYDNANSVYNTGIAFRYTDNNNFLHAIVVNNALELRKRINNVSTLIQSYTTGAMATGMHNFKVILNGDSIRVLLDGVERISAVDSFNNTATKHGMRIYAQKGYFDNFKVSKLGEEPTGAINDVVALGAKADGITDDSALFSTTVDNYIQTGKIVALSISKFNSITSKFKGEGRIKILGMPLPYYAWANHPQGTIYPNDMSDQIIMDMNLPNEAVPAFAQTKQKISGTYPFNDISMPSTYAKCGAWGQIFLKEGLSYPTESYVYMENMTTIVYRNSTNRWEVLSKTLEIGGALFDADYGETGVTPSPTVTYTTYTKYGTNGIKILMNSSAFQRCFHSWSNKNDPNIGFSIVPSDIKFVITYCDMWTDPATTDMYVANFGGDYKSADGQQIKEICNGRFKNITSTKRRFYATNLDYNNYFTYCNQALIDSLT